MQTVTIYRPEGIERYEGTTNLQLESGVVQFSTTADCMLQRKPVGNPEYKTRVRDRLSIKTNLPFFVEEAG